MSFVHTCKVVALELLTVSAVLVLGVGVGAGDGVGVGVTPWL